MLADQIMPRLTRVSRTHGRHRGRRAVAHAAHRRHRRIGARRSARRPGQWSRAAFPLAYLPGTDGVDLRLTARGLPAAEADERLGGAAAAAPRTHRPLRLRRRIRRPRGGGPGGVPPARTDHRRRRELHRRPARRASHRDSGVERRLSRRCDRLRQSRQGITARCVRGRDAGRRSGQ